jgi:type II secretory pathway pseudopilin PulG
MMEKDKKMFLGYISRSGLTGIETLIAVGVASIVVPVLLGSIIFFYRSNTYTIEQSVAVKTAQEGMDKMVKDIREATFSDTGLFPLVDASKYAFTFFSDADQDNSVERIHYFIDGADSKLKRGITDAVGNPLAYPVGDTTVGVASEHIRNMDQTADLFRYFDETGATLAEPFTVSDIAYVKIELIVNVNPSRGPIDFILRSTATPRNIKGN